MDYKDYYKTLGVDRNASQDAIKQSYRRLARKYHPDVSKEADAETRFKEVQEAYEVLKDKEKRSAYDQFGSNYKAGQEFRPPPDWNSGSGFRSDGFSSGSEFSDFFESLFGHARARNHTTAGRPGEAQASRGQDQQSRVSIDLEDAYSGATRAITLRGGGVVPGKSRTLNVKIPKGIHEGQKIRLPSQGQSGNGNGHNGDLYLEVSFTPHRYFRPEKRDIYLDLPVTPWEAALGKTVTVPTLGGKVELRIPPGSQSGKKLRLKGKGLPGKQVGDQYVILQMVTPEANTEQSIEFYEQMASTMPMDPRSALK